MAVLKEVKKSYMDHMAIEDVTEYIMCLEHTVDGEILGGAVYPEDAEEQMRLVRQCYHKETGRQVRHFLLSFYEWDRISEEMLQVLHHSITTYFGRNYQCVSAIHRNTDNVHIHIVINTVCYWDGHMYCDGYQGLYSLVSHIHSIYPDLAVELVYGEDDRA